MGSEPTESEEHLWGQLWSTPQAVVWERLGWTRTVARYCRVAVIAEGPNGAEAWSEARQMEDRLGLTPKAMRLLLWVISEDEVSKRRTEEEAPKRPGMIRAVE